MDRATAYWVVPLTSRRVDRCPIPPRLPGKRDPWLAGHGLDELSATLPGRARRLWDLTASRRRPVFGSSSPSTAGPGDPATLPARLPGDRSSGTTRWRNSPPESCAATLRAAGNAYQTGLTLQTSVMRLSGQRGQR